MNRVKLSVLANKVRVLIVPGRDPVGDWMASVITAESDMYLGGLVRDVRHLPDTVKGLSPDVVVVDISSGILQDSQLLDSLAAPRSGVAVIVVAMLGEVEMVQQAMLHGAHGFLLKPFTEADLLTSIRQAYGLLLQRRAELSEIGRLPPGVVAPPPSVADVIAVFGPKGGVGCTTVAVNLAVALRRETGRRTVLVDGDLCFGDVDSALNLVSPTSITSILPKLATLDDDALEEILVPHASGIQVLPASADFDTDGVRPEHLGHLLTRLAELGEGFVVVDTWSTLDNSTLAILDCCQHLVVVTTPHVMALRDVRRFLDAMRLLEYDLGRVLLVVNHCYHRSDVNLQDVERILGLPVAQSIEYAPGLVSSSLNRGVPLVIEQNSSLVAQNIHRLSRLVVDRCALPVLPGKPSSAQIAPNGSKGKGLWSWRRGG